MTGLKFCFSFPETSTTPVSCLQIHPKLNQMDQDKVARIYSDLRKESMVSHLHLPGEQEII